jgi:hypothetical protein
MRVLLRAALGIVVLSLCGASLFLFAATTQLITTFASRGIEGVLVWINHISWDGDIATVFQEDTRKNATRFFVIYLIAWFQFGLSLKLISFLHRKLQIKAPSTTMQPNP